MEVYIVEEMELAIGSVDDAKLDVTVALLCEEVLDEQNT